MKTLNKPKIIVAISGGIDSSVAAALLKKDNFDVTAVFLKLADLSHFKKAEARARKIAKILGIRFLVLDLRQEFQKTVIDYFMKEIKLGRTPNPCVVCNKEIKFGILLKKAKELGVDFVATGHYARKSASGFLREAKDTEKDQSYFLWTLTRKQLKHILFPLGNYTKEEVRGLAKRFKLPVFAVPESQEICFIETTANDFLKECFKPKVGKIVDINGNMIGQHQGLVFYTIGQRKAIGLSGGPYYVLGKDSNKNFLIVTKTKKDLYRKNLVAKNINWTSGAKPRLPLRLKAKIRYRHKAVPGTLREQVSAGNYNLVFGRPQRAITSGQSVVFYKRKEVLGGGIIK